MAEKGRQLGVCISAIAKAIREKEGGRLKCQFSTTLYIDLSRGKTFKGGIEKIIFLCARIYPKKKPPVPQYVPR
jgi:hypothetical protein